MINTFRDTTTRDLFERRGEFKSLLLIHPSEILGEDFLIPMGISHYRLAKSIGVDSHRINAIVQGNCAITAETAIKLSQFFGTSARLWLGLQTQYDLELANDRLGVEVDEERIIPAMVPESDTDLSLVWRSP